jgi:hypothetical protein
MNRDDFFRKVLEIFPEAIIDEEYATGELMISTGWKFDTIDTIVPLVEK